MPNQRLPALSCKPHWTLPYLGLPMFLISFGCSFGKSFLTGPLQAATKITIVRKVKTCSCEKYFLIVHIVIEGSIFLPGWMSGGNHPLTSRYLCSMGFLCYVSLERQSSKDMKMRICTKAAYYSFSRNWRWLKIWAEILYVSPYCINTFVGNSFISAYCKKSQER